MAQPTVDQILKEMADHHLQQFLSLILPKAKYQIISTKLDKELTIKTRLTDKVVRLKTKNGERVIHFEFQLRYHRKIPERLFVYSGALTAKYQLQVASILFLIRPSRQVGEVGSYASEVDGKKANEFSFPVIHLWKLREAILSGDKKFRVFAPLLLEIDPKPDADLLRRVREIISREANPQRRAELVSFTIPVARRHFGLAVIQSIFQESDMTNVEWEKLPHFGKALKEKQKEALLEGREEGREEGETLGTQEMMIEVLSIKFGHVPLRTMRVIRGMQDRRVLKAMIRKVLNADSMREAHRLLTESKTRAIGRNGASALKHVRPHAF